jgi:hypothetical protein
MNNNYAQFEGALAHRNLARWLADVMATSDQDIVKDSTQSSTLLDLQFNSDYHLRFYRQLPDFIMALLSNDASATVKYAPLLYHLAGCRECHHEFLELYDAMYAAIYPQGVRPLLGQGTRTLAATPPRMLGHLCQTLISQAEAVLLQARHDHTDADEEARSLLQLAIRISAHISQSSIRRQGLQDLVHAATLFDGAPAPVQEQPDTHAYTPVLAGSGSVRGRKMGHGTTLERSIAQDQPAILLQSQGLEGRIIQNGQTLELHLQDLAPALRGHHIAVSIVLGSLLDAVRWQGGNPQAILSEVPVDEHGWLVTPLGETSLHLSNPEEHHLLEAMFLRLEVQAAD